MVVARKVDRYLSGIGKHKLAATCERHGVKLEAAHRASSDARAAGEVFHVLMAKHPAAELESYTLGDLLHWMRCEQNDDWHRFHTWLSQQPPLQP